MSAGRREFAKDETTVSAVASRRTQEERENEGVATLFDEMVAVAVQAVLSSV